MGWKSKTAVVLTVVGIGGGAMMLVDRPSNTAELQEQHRQQQMEDLSDAQENSDARKENDADALRHAEDAKRGIPVIPDPDGEHVRLPKLPFPWK